MPKNPSVHCCPICHTIFRGRGAKKKAADCEALGRPCYDYDLYDDVWKDGYKGTIAGMKASRQGNEHVAEYLIHFFEGPLFGQEEWYFEDSFTPTP